MEDAARVLGMRLAGAGRDGHSADRIANRRAVAYIRVGVVVTG